MNNKIKMALDVIMTVIFICLIKLSFTGVTVHEILGIGILVLFIIHNILNYKWIAAVCTNFFTDKVKGKAKFMFVLNVLLFVFTSFTVISGILISQSLFPEISLSDTSVWSPLHHFAAYSSLVLISVHLGLHWSMIINFFKKVLKMRNENGTRTWLARVIALALAIFGVKALINQNIQTNFTAPFVSQSQNISSSATLDDNQSGISQSTDNGTLVETTSLEEYLSKLYCSGCHNRCPLTNLRCSRGNSYKQQAVEEYQQSQSSSSTADSSSSITKNSSDSIQDDSNNSQITADSSTSDSPSLEDYLSKLTCSGCGKRCPLTNLKCGRGNSYKQQATTEYNQKYSQITTSTTSSSSITVSKLSTTTTNSNTTTSSTAASTDSNSSSASALDIIGIMSFVIAGTHYAVTLPKKLKQK